MKIIAMSEFVFADKRLHILTALGPPPPTLIHPAVNEHIISAPLKIFNIIT
jgi:hypothetical protein